MARLSNIRPMVASLPPRIAVAPKIADSFYQSPEWRDLVRSIKSMRGSYCERCGSSNRVIADHVVERKDGGADLDPSNIELLCAPCHNRKTAKARARRARGEGG